MAIRLAGGRFDYVLEEDRDSEEPTVFIIKELTAEERAALAAVYPLRMLARWQALLTKQQKDPESVTDEDLEKLQRQITRARKRVCKLGLTEIRGVLDTDGKPVEITVDEVIDRIADHNHIRELAAAVLERNRLRAAEKKT